RIHTFYALVMSQLHRETGYKQTTGGKSPLGGVNKFHLTCRLCLFGKPGSAQAVWNRPRSHHPSEPSDPSKHSGTMRKISRHPARAAWTGRSASRNLRPGTGRACTPAPESRINPAKPARNFYGKIIAR